MSSTRRLSVRRGSVSAPDPLGKNAAVNYDPNRSTSSTLTIVRVLDPASSATAADPPSSPVHSRRSLRRSTNAPGASPGEGRLSFAFSSFSPTLPAQPPSPGTQAKAAPSPSSSPRLRPSSPQFTRRHSASGGSGFSKPNLTPEQLVDLARQSSLPRYVPGQANPIAAETSPATFTLLPDDVYLPFVDRVAETAHLLSIPPTKRLFSLLAQTFTSQSPSESAQDPFVVAPAQWTFQTLRRWLTEVDRTSANDAMWVRKARECVLAHSELIWERLKGALGVPPELELEDLDASQFFDAADNASAVSLPQDEPVTVFADHSPPSPDPMEFSPSPDQSLVIEPILATSSSNHPPSASVMNNPPPSSLPTGDQVLQDIVEDREDEEEEESGADITDKDHIKSKDDSRAQIHGLRVCTSPIPPSAPTPPMFSYPPSPAMSMIASGRDSVEPLSPGPDLSHSSLTRRLSRTSSHGSITSIGGRWSGSSRVHRDMGYNVAPSEIGDSESERAYDPIADRVPGNPLFPSNFARLALRPTLRANNPSPRSPHVTTPRWKRWAPGSRPPSWFEGWDGVKNEYAATDASDGSVAGGE